MESKQMWWWSGVAVIGFLVLIALVVALGTVSTKRYERERSQRAFRPRQPRGLSAPAGETFDTWDRGGTVGRGLTPSELSSGQGQSRDAEDGPR
jgi:hypothetical protein